MTTIPDRYLDLLRGDLLHDLPKNTLWIRVKSHQS
jgi:hypothetical protein